MVQISRTCAPVSAAAAAVLSLLLPVQAHADHLGYAGAAGTAGPIISLSADTLPAGRSAAGLRLTYANPDDLSDTELAARAGRHIHAHTTDALISPSLSLAYGASDDFTLALSVPWVERRKLREGTHQHFGGVALNGVEDLGSPSGVGDAILMGQYRVIGDEDAAWRVAVLAGLKMPTGATHERSPDGERLETEHQPGTGSWDPLAGVAMSHRIGRYSLDGNVLYQFSRRGVQATTLGDRAQANLSLSYRLGGETPHVHSDDHHDHEHHEHPTAMPGAVDLVLELNGEWEGRQTVAGMAERESGGRVLYLSPGVRFNAPSGWAASVSAGLPVAQKIRPSHPENGFRLTAGLAKAF